MSELTELAPEKEWKQPFLATLAETGNVTLAARAAGVSRAWPYIWKSKDEEFANAWNEALEMAIDDLEAIARDRAKTISDTLLIFLLKAHRPKKYRDHLPSSARTQAKIDVTRLAAILDSLGYERRGKSAHHVIEIEPSGLCSNGESGQVANGHTPHAAQQESNGSDQGHRAAEEPPPPDHDAPPSWQE